ncbi:4-hydroxy-tetrahydrodipicolinate reductase [Actinobaculum suis]|uniref:4-hydroxy-tetrahydrodipicolinate reductase n=1 Tax=Actinobaculum suis TaxID=1657 RepID=A0A1G6ZHG6_9ACTO|nr:4-hydroxy-tetrahydrodipicolinate reductase [Actinobaculum suis]MDY5153914.1 4-hydroxy-tetrahydrodipicolinate reductase [Actinobaculum suis]SDE01086.1 4-hydroxy-tetrahydrodipicolinate reductase [Actinobaculum suis]
MIKVAVVGASGRMGKTVCDAVTAAADLKLVARLDHGDPLTAENLNGATVAVEFTVPDATKANVLALLEAGVDVVVGTSGWDDADLAEVKTRAQETGQSVLVAPNFGLSAVLAMKFAELAAPYFESVEVLEMHHPDKVDAPSGTAFATAQRIAQARQKAGVPASPDATTIDPEGARGAVIDDVHVHAVRLRGLNAHEEILLGNPAEQLVIRQDSFDRTSFMPGVLLAVRKISGRGGLTYGLEDLLDL